jgi:hypothetical protein
MIYFRDGPYLVSRSTFREMVMRVTYDTSWVGHSENLYEFETPQETGLFFSGVSKLQVLPAYIVKSEDGVMSPFWDIITLQHFRVLCLPE